MATVTSTNDLQEIVDIFLQNNSIELNDRELIESLSQNGIRVSSDRLSHIIRSTGSSLFQVENEKKTSLVRLEPKIFLCEDFLSGRCNTKTGPCPHLHACRYFDSCRNSKCRRPHDFTRGVNRRLIWQNQCQNLDPVRLFRLLQLKRQQSAPTTSSISIDLSCPSFVRNRPVDIEQVKTFLRSNGFPIEKILFSTKNEYFHRWRISVRYERFSTVENLLKNRYLSYEDVQLKFKSIESKLDEKSFLLQAKIDERFGRITKEKFNIYIDVLLQRLSKSIVDLSTSSEHLLLVQCDENLDFKSICQIQNNRRQLQGRDVMFKRVNEIDVVTIESIDPKVPIDMKILDQIQDEIFAVTFVQSTTMSVEFIHRDELKRWLIDRDENETKFNVQIRPKFNFSDQPSSEIREIQLPHRFAMVIHHPIFGEEYRNFIRTSSLHVDIKIDEKRVKFRDDFDVTTEKLSILDEQTKHFMKLFAFRTIQLKQPDEQRKIIEENSKIVAFYYPDANRCMLATKSANIASFMQKLVPKQGKCRQRGGGATVVKPSTKTIFVSLSLRSTSQITLFSDRIIEERIFNFIRRTCHVQSEIDPKSNANQRLVKITGLESNIEQARQNLFNLSSLCRTKIYDHVSNHPWLKIPDAIFVIQHFLHLANVTCVCDYQTNPVALQIHFIDKTHSEFGVDEQIFDDWCSKRLSFVSVPIDVRSPFYSKWTEILNEIRSHVDYRRKISLCYENSTILLYGVPELINVYQQQCQQMKQREIDHRLAQQKYAAAAPPVKPTPQLPLNFNVDQRLAQQKYAAPPPPVKSTPQLPLNSNVDHVLAQEKYAAPPPPPVKPTPRLALNFNIDQLGFASLLVNDSSRFTSIIPSNCSVEKQLINVNMQIEVPLSHAEKIEEETTTNVNDTPATTPPVDNRSFWEKLFGKRKSTPLPSPPSPRPTSSTITSVSLNVGRSKISVCQGDLRTQQVDAIVVASTSRYLCESITQAAGNSASSLYQVQSSENLGSWECDGGTLPCKKIIFRPWKADRSSPTYFVKQSAETFVSSAIDYVLKQHLTSIAFPSVGCGQLGFDPKTIAEYMIGETYQQLRRTSLTVTFVIEPKQTNVFDAFTQQLKTQRPLDLQPEIITFIKQTVKISLTSTDANVLKETQKKIEHLARSCSTQVQLTDKHDLVEWPQETIRTYFRHCLKNNVIPTMKIPEGTLELVGPRDEVSEAEKYFYQLTADALRQARKNGANPIDSSLPRHWNPNGPFFQLVRLSTSSTEYQDVLKKFDATMKTMYKKIVSIERVQNRRWYKQYVAHREEYQQRYNNPNEKHLFHGCPKSSAEKIVKECFNRTFAGVNGVVYGCGVYFHSESKYSHHYTRVEQSGERTMFLAKVLVGRTTLGSSTMKIPPTGFDTTTDGKDIFVVYHDASAYAEYLITYI